MHEIYVFRSIVSRLVHPFVHSQKQRRCEERERRKKKSAIQCDDFGAFFFAWPNGNQWHKILTHQMRMRRCSWEFLRSFRVMFSGGYVTAFASDDGSIRWMYSTYLWISNFSFHTYIIQHTVVGNIPEEEEEETKKNCVNSCFSSENIQTNKIESNCHRQRKTDGGCIWSSFQPRALNMWETVALIEHGAPSMCWFVCF